MMVGWLSDPHELSRWWLFRFVDSLKFVGNCAEKRHTAETTQKAQPTEAIPEPSKHHLHPPKTVQPPQPKLSDPPVVPPASLSPWSLENEARTSPSFPSTDPDLAAEVACHSDFIPGACRDTDANWDTCFYPDLAPVARHSNFVHVTCRGTNRHSDTCFYFPVCKSFGCGNKKGNCLVGKKWRAILANEDETKFEVTEDACYFYPLCASRNCNGKREDCATLRDWNEAIQETPEFLARKLQEKKLLRNKRQKIDRAAAKRHKTAEKASLPTQPN